MGRKLAKEGELRSLLVVDALWKITHAGREDQAGHVYVIDANCQTKIGISTNPTKRLSNLETQGGFQIARKWISARLTDPRAVELELHQKFASQRIKGEWFASDVYQQAVELLTTAQNESEAQKDMRRLMYAAQAAEQEVRTLERLNAALIKASSMKEKLTGENAKHLHERIIKTAGHIYYRYGGGTDGNTAAQMFWQELGISKEQIHTVLGSEIIDVFAAAEQIKQRMLSGPRGATLSLASLAY